MKLNLNRTMFKPGPTSSSRVRHIQPGTSNYSHLVEVVERTMDKYDKQAKGYLTLDEALEFATVLAEADPNSHFIPMIKSVFEQR